MSVSALLLAYAEDLNDAEAGHEFTVWSEAQLLRYHNEGACLIASMRPDMFSIRVVIKVQPCTEAQDVCECTSVHKVLGQTDKDGRILHTLRRKNASSVMEWSGRKCGTPRNTTRLKEYSIDTSTNTVSVYPPISEGAEVYIALECTMPPKPLAMGGDASDVMRCAFAAALTQYVLYRAKEVDELSPALRAASKDHFASFMAMLLAIKSADDSYRLEAKKK